jgi:cyanophycinase-like exopeptidase
MIGGITGLAPSYQEDFMTAALLVSLVVLAQAGPAPESEPMVGPHSGSLVIDGGGQNPATIRAFVTLAGGPDAEFVLIPTANEVRPENLERVKERFAKAFGVSHVAVLHARDRAEADTEAFVVPLKTARGVWFGGGRQWRLVDAYMGTRTQPGRPSRARTSSGARARVTRP